MHLKFNLQSSKIIYLVIIFLQQFLNAANENANVGEKYPRFSYNAALNRLFWLSNISYDKHNGILNATKLLKFSNEMMQEIPKLYLGASSEVHNDRLSCIEDIVTILKGFMDSSTPANYKWIDSLGKPMPGITGGAIHWPGSFEQCLGTYGNFNINNGYLPENNTENLTTASYCDLVIDLPLPNDLPNSPGLGINIGLCLPASCNISIVVDIVSPVLSKVSLKVDEVATYCHTSPDVLAKDKWFWISTALTSLYLILMACGTLLDFALWLRWKWIWEYNLRDKSSPIPDAQVLLQVDNEEEDLGIHSVPTSNPTPEKNQLTYTEFRSKYLRDKPWVIYWFSAYSVPINAAKLWNAPKTTSVDSEGNVIDHPLCILDGIRCITMMWIIYGHCLVFSMLQSNNVLLFAESHLKRWTFQVIVSGTFSVDTFFLMSGLLTSYITIPRLEKLNSVTKSLRFWSVFVLHRIIRLSPVYFTVLVLYTGFFHHAWDGPMFPQRAELTDVRFCHSHWWVTYLNNLVYSDEMCLPWSWYLANELQFSIVLAPIFLTLLRVHASAGLAFAVALIFSAMGSMYGVSYANHYLPGMLSFQSFLVTYMKPYTRWGTYAMGLILGWILHSKRCKLPQRPSLQHALLFTVGGMLFAAACCLSTVYGLYGVVSGQVPPLTNEVSAFYNAVSRPVFVLGIAIIIFLCANQYATPVRAFLSWSGFSPFSRLTYGAYLVHPIVILFLRFASQSPALLDDVFLMQNKNISSNKLTTTGVKCTQTVVIRDRRSMLQAQECKHMASSSLESSSPRRMSTARPTSSTSKN